MSRLILELGCGTDAHVQLLVKEGDDVYGVDVNETMLQQAGDLHAHLSSEGAQGQSPIVSTDTIGLGAKRV